MRPELARTVRERGPFEGRCAECDVEAEASASWLEIDGQREHARLIVPADRRGDVIAELEEHLRTLRRRTDFVRAWMLSPAVQCEAARTPLQPDTDTNVEQGAEESTHPRPRERSAEIAVEAAKPIAANDPPARASGEAAGRAPGVPVPINAEHRREPSVPRSPTLGAYVGELSLHKDCVQATAVLEAGATEHWRSAQLRAWPVLLRDYGYPLLGVRIVAAYMGQTGCIDAVIDVADVHTDAIFKTLTRSFLLDLVVDIDGERIVRDVRNEGLEQNASLCFDSATAIVLGRHFSNRTGFAKAVEALRQVPLDDRLVPHTPSIDAGAYQHLIGGREVANALAHLDRVSRKSSLARLLEVDGLSLPDYDAVRRRVLQASVDYGLIAPRRFWRRIIVSKMAGDLGDYARKLSHNREFHSDEEGDLEPDELEQAWQGIWELCDRHNIAPPEPVRRALGLAEVEPSVSGPSKAAGEINGSPHQHLVSALRDPEGRLKAATDLLRTKGADIEPVLEALDEFDTDELLALLPDLSELGQRVVPGLIPKLSAARREVRQAAAIVLGVARDPGAVQPLAERLLVEPTKVWLDVARSLGAFGPMAIHRVCEQLLRYAGTRLERVALERVSRMFAEVALSDDEVEDGRGRPGHDAVAVLVDSDQVLVSTAARRALATLHDVSESTAAMRGEIPLHEDTAVRGFARRAYEAIMVPELEVEAEA